APSAPSGLSARSALSALSARIARRARRPLERFGNVGIPSAVRRSSPWGLGAVRRSSRPSPSLRSSRRLLCAPRVPFGPPPLGGRGRGGPGRVSGHDPARVVAIINPPPAAPLHDAVLSPDGNTLAYLERESVLLKDLGTGLVRTLEGARSGRASSACLAWSTD